MIQYNGPACHLSCGTSVRVRFRSGVRTRGTAGRVQAMTSIVMQTAPSAWLVPLSGPPLDPIELLPATAAAGLTLGRQEQCDIRLPAEADKVSRCHARFTYAGRRWR